MTYRTEFPDVDPAGATEIAAVAAVATYGFSTMSYPRRVFGRAAFAAGTHQGGYVLLNGVNQASLWSGSAASWISLHPAGASSSAVYAITESKQVGQVNFSGVTHASLWSGTASWVDLMGDPHGKFESSRLAGVGRIAASNISSAVPGTAGMDHRPNRPSMVREALKSGLVQQTKLGVNPLKFGIVASSDTHLGAPGLVEEANAKGHGGAGVRSTRGLPDDLEFNPGGLAVLWAEENSRDALFDAMQRREAYGTSGTRPVVRFFGGWDFDAALCKGADFAKQGYARGVPMGGDLKKGAAGKAPTFAVWALQDPGTKAMPGTPLAQIQIVKGWVEGGQARETVVDVVSAKGRGSVDPKTCTTSGQGADQLCRVWKDDHFDPKQHAFYYARVLENPTCRWSQRLCVEAGVDCAKPETVTPGYEGCCRPDHVKTIQERAWTSPIWYTP